MEDAKNCIYAVTVTPDGKSQMAAYPIVRVDGETITILTDKNTNSMAEINARDFYTCHNVRTGTMMGDNEAKLVKKWDRAVKRAAIQEFSVFSALLLKRDQQQTGQTTQKQQETPSAASETEPVPTPIITEKVAPAAVKVETQPILKLDTVSDDFPAAEEEKVPSAQVTKEPEPEQEKKEEAAPATDSETYGMPADFNIRENVPKHVQEANEDSHYPRACTVSWDDLNQFLGLWAVKVFGPESTVFPHAYIYSNDWFEDAEIWSVKLTNIDTDHDREVLGYIRQAYDARKGDIVLEGNEAMLSETLVCRLMGSEILPKLDYPFPFGVECCYCNEDGVTFISPNL